ncbi:hypothetical protein D9M68_585060 [compost metagenome]
MGKHPLTVGALGQRQPDGVAGDGNRGSSEHAIVGVIAQVQDFISQQAADVALAVGHVIDQAIGVAHQYRDAIRVQGHQRLDAANR